MDSPHQLVTQVVTACFGDSTRLERVELIRGGDRNAVLRVFLEGGQAPESVVAKVLKSQHQRGFTDLASLRFLGGIDGMERVAPRVLGASDDGRVFLMEDLGGSRSLENVLAAGDATATVRHLETLARQMAAMAAATRTVEESVFTRIRREYPGYVEVSREAEVMNWRAGLGRLEALVEALGLRMQRPAALCVQQLGQTFAEAAGALVFSHGDPAPTNNHLAADGSVRLLDFEYGAYRHVYYDLTGWFVLCPLPLPWVEAMVRAFRERLAEALPAAADPLWHAHHWATICAYRAVAMLGWISETAVEEDRSWVGDWSARSAMISTTLRLYQATALEPDLAPLAEFALEMAENLRGRWPELGDGAIQWPGAPFIP